MSESATISGNGSSPRSERQGADSSRIPPSASRPARNPILALFSSVWFGIWLLVLLFIYSSIGSAMPWIRQKPFFEMTEFEWFHWWPFDVLVALICLNIAVVTIRRIPLRLVNAGVWMIHAGIIILAIGSVYYFGTKVEGDAPVFRRWVKIYKPGMAQPEGLVVLPGNRRTFQTPEGRYTVTVEQTNSEYRLMTGADQGERAHAVTLRIDPPNGSSFLRQLLTGYPEYTEDVIPGQGRAIKVTGKALVDESLETTLEYEPQRWFHVVHSWALYVRELGAKEWIQIPIRELPRYNEYVSSRDQVFADEPIVLRPLDVPVKLPIEALRMGEATAHFTGFLPYAEMRQQWLDGGERLNPMLRLNFIDMDGQPRPVELLALDPSRRIGMRGLVEFRLASDESQLASLPTDSSAQLTVRIPALDVTDRMRIDENTSIGGDGPWTAIGKSGYFWRLRQVMENLELSPGRTASVAWVDLKSPQKEWTRVVMDDPAGSFDLGELGFDPHRAPRPADVPLDASIMTEFTPSSARLIFVALTDGRLYAVWNGSASTGFRRFIRIGEPLTLAPNITVTATSLALRAVSDVKPYIVPPARRARNVGSAYAMIKLDLTAGGRTQSRWVRYSEYAFDAPEYSYPGRYLYLPTVVAWPDGRRFEILFSRERRPLPTAVALEDFELLAQVGGYTGDNLTVRNWRSQLRFWDNEQWSTPRAVSVNSPTDYGGFWYYQAAWDPPPRDDPSGGMNYTVLGVGNRNGVNVMLAGCCLSVVGMIFAFYVKPRLKARRRAMAQRKVDHDGTAGHEPVAVPQEEVAAVS